MNSTKRNSLFFKLFSLLSVVRGYNILVLIAAQYLAAIFIFSPEKSVKSVLFDLDLFYLVIATTCVIASGYIINNFYDVKADRINRPLKTGIDSHIKQETKLSLYFFLNFVGFIFGFFVSWRAAIFFASYIFSIWFYSHKLKKHPVIGLLSAATLTILPFFVVFIHYKNFSKVIFVHATFLFLIILTRELIKDLENIKGAIANNYNTFPVQYGEQNTKKVILLLVVFTLIPIAILFNYPAIQYMKYYFYFASLVLTITSYFVWKSNQKKQYTLLHNILKILLLIGVFSLIFIDPSLILNKVVKVLH